MTTYLEENKIENFSNDDQVKKFNFLKFARRFKVKKENFNENCGKKEKFSIKKLFKRNKEEKVYVNFPSGYGKCAKYFHRFPSNCHNCLLIAGAYLLIKQKENGRIFEGWKHEVNNLILMELRLDG